MNRPSATVPELIELAEVSKRYGQKAVVDRVSFTVARGEMLALLGGSGSGKTTTLKMINRLVEPSSGRIRIDGREVSEGAPHDLRRSIGYVLQEVGLFPHMTVAENVAITPRLLGWDRSRIDERVRELLEMVDLDPAEVSARSPSQLSGGQRQRVGIARALCAGPRVMLLDEPFSGLDTRLREQIRDDTLHVLKHSGAATLMVTHDPEEAMFMADRIAVMRDGHVEQDGRPVDVYGTPASAFVAAFFGQVNIWRGVVAGGAVDTPIGRVAAPGLAEGSAAEVVVRPEGMKLSPADGPAEPAVAAKVLAARLLGRSSWIHLCCGDDQPGPREGEAGHLHFHARVPGRFLPCEGEVFGVTVDPAQVFVFAIGDTR